MKEYLGLSKMTVKKLCTLAVLVGITVFLAIFCTFRVGNAIKIPFKFISVFVTASVFGPVWGGVVAALGDILNSFFVPVGAPLPQITVVEFVCGFVFGLFYYKTDKMNYYTKTVLCALLLTVIDIIPMSYILTSVGYFPSFLVAVSVRISASVIKFFMYIVVCVILRKYLVTFERLINK